MTSVKLKQRGTRASKNGRAALISAHAPRGLVRAKSNDQVEHRSYLHVLVRVENLPT